MIRLLGIRYSPWTQRARWALDHCGIRHRFEDYLPGMAEPLLRLRMRRFSGLVQVPVLFADGEVIAGSDAIARYAARISEGAPLGDLAACERWEALADAACCEGRLLLIQRSLADSRALEDALAGTVPRALRPRLRWLSRAVLRMLEGKYGALARPGAMREALSSAQQALAGQRYLLGSFSYADVALASALQMVAPLMIQPPAMRAAWTWPTLAREFADLIAWRSQLLAETNPRLARHVSLAA